MGHLSSPDSHEPVAICGPVFGDKERVYVLEALESGWISSAGPFIGRFERAFAELCGVKHAETCANGTVALHLVLHALGIRAGDEVIVPTETFVASANAILYCGATPVFCEVDDASWVIDVHDALARVTPKTKAIIAVDLFGTLADYDALRAGLRAMGRGDVKIIEDAAESIGSSHLGRKAGSLADAAIFSFFANKTLTTGEGGAVTTDDLDLAARMKLLKNHGMDSARKYYHPEMGFNYRMTNLQAAVGCAQLEILADLCARKQRHNAVYRARLARVDGIRFARVPAGQNVVPWLHTIIDERLANEAARDAVLVAMRARGIEGRPFFVPLHTFPYFDKSPVHGVGALPRSERLAARGLALPSSAGLSAADIERCCVAFLAARAEVLGV